MSSMKFFFYFIIFIGLSDLAYASAQPINLSDLRKQNANMNDDELIQSLIEKGSDFSNGNFAYLHLKNEEVIRSLFESGRSFVGSYFSHMILEGIENLKLHGDFTSVTFSWVRFPKGTDFTLANLNQTQFIGGYIEEGLFVGMKLEGTSFEYFTELQRVNLEGALLKGVQFNDVKIRNSNFKNTQLVGVKFYKVLLYNANLLESQPQKLIPSDVFLSYDKIPEEFLSESEKEGLESMKLADNKFVFFINMKPASRSIFQTGLKTELQPYGSITKYWIETPHDKLSQGDFLSLKNFIMEQVLKVYPFKRLSSVDLDQLEQLVNVEVSRSDKEVQEISDFLDTQRVGIFGRFKDLSSSTHEIPLISLEVGESMNKILNEVFYLERLGKEISLKQVIEQELDAEIMIREKDGRGVGPSFYVVKILISGLKNKFWHKRYFDSQKIYEMTFHDNTKSIKFPIRTFQSWDPVLKASFVWQGLKREREDRMGPIRRFVQWEKERREKDVLRKQQSLNGCAKLI